MTHTFWVPLHVHITEEAPSSSWSPLAVWPFSAL